MSFTDIEKEFEQQANQESGQSEVQDQQCKWMKGSFDIENFTVTWMSLISLMHKPYAGATRNELFYAQWHREERHDQKVRMICEGTDGPPSTGSGVSKEGIIKKMSHFVVTNNLKQD